MTIADMSRIVAKYGQDASFVSNLICMRHKNAGRKMRGLIELLKAGHSVRTAQFSCDVLIVDGTRHEWEFLETYIRTKPEVR